MEIDNDPSNGKFHGVIEYLLPTYDQNVLTDSRRIK